MVLVGPSGRGKTTASRELGRHFAYVSDETIAISADGAVHPYRKPLSIIDDPAAPKIQVPPSQLGLRPLPDADLRVAAVALLDRRPDHAGEPVVEPLDLGDALAELVAQSSYLASHRAPLSEIAAIVHATGGVRRITYREAADLVPAIGALADAGRVEGGPSAEPLDLPAPARHQPGDRPRFTRATAIDAVALADPDRIAVMTSTSTARDCARDRRSGAGRLARGLGRDAGGVDGCRARGPWAPARGRGGRSRAGRRRRADRGGPARV